jgi:8-oxo-dGTP pyrophosphatase MutT (NUDIX family)
VPGFYYLDPAAPQPNRPRSIGVAALIERDGALLLDSRVDPPAWGLIAGSLEAEESIPDGLHREVAEETGLVVSSYELFGTFSHPSRIVQYADGNTFRSITIAVTVAVDDFAPLRPSSETNELRFVPKAELRELDLAATHRPIIDRYLSGGTPPFLE